MIFISNCQQISLRWAFNDLHRQFVDDWKGEEWSSHCPSHQVYRSRIFPAHQKRHATPRHQLFRFVKCPIGMKSIADLQWWGLAASGQCLGFVTGCCYILEVYLGTILLFSKCILLPGTSQSVCFLTQLLACDWLQNFKLVSNWLHNCIIVHYSAHKCATSAHFQYIQRNCAQLSFLRASAHSSSSPRSHGCPKRNPVGMSESSHLWSCSPSCGTQVTQENDKSFLSQKRRLMDSGKTEEQQKTFCCFFPHPSGRKQDTCANDVLLWSKAGFRSRTKTNLGRLICGWWCKFQGTCLTGQVRKKEPLTIWTLQLGSQTHIPQNYFYSVPLSRAVHFLQLRNW